MLKLRYIIPAILSLLVFSGGFAQSKSTATVLRRKSAEKNESVDKTQEAKADNGRRQSRVSEPGEADTQWLKIVYRDLDLVKGHNGALKNVNDSNADLFAIMMNLIAEGKLTAYEYVDGVERFDEDWKVDPKALLDRFNVDYTLSPDGKPVIDPLDMPAGDVARYYIVERYVFDSRAGKVKRIADAICPVLVRSGIAGSEPIRYPMFWVRVSDLSPYIASTVVMTDDDNNLARHTLDDFFTLNLYSGELYKTRNVANKTLMQIFPDPDDLAHARDSIEHRLVAFEKGLWTPAFKGTGESKVTKERHAEIKESKSTTENVKPVKEKTVSSRAGAVRSVRRKR